MANGVLGVATELVHDHVDRMDCNTGIDRATNLPLNTVDETVQDHVEHGELAIDAPALVRLIINMYKVVHG